MEKLFTVEKMGPQERAIHEKATGQPQFYTVTECGIIVAERHGIEIKTATAAVAKAVDRGTIQTTEPREGAPRLVEISAFYKWLPEYEPRGG